MYQKGEYGSAIIVQLESARKFNLWIGQILRPFVGDRVLEIGAGIGNLSSQFIPRELYVVSDTNPHYLCSYAHGKPYVPVLRIDATDSVDFAGLKGQFDKALMINVLEHASDEQLALKNVSSALAAGGRAVILVPSHPGLCVSQDIVLGR
jgi:SAM-dependent methyltransferase